MEAAIIARKCETAVTEALQNEILGAKVELALVEILNNIILHGHHSDIRQNLTITLEMLISDTEINIRIWDSGIVWKPDMREMVTDVNEIDRKNRGFAVSGRGIDIIKEIFDEFTVRNFPGINETAVKIKL